MYSWYAERYHWTPKQVDEEVPLWLDGRLVMIAGEIDRLIEERQERARNQ